MQPKKREKTETKKEPSPEFLSSDQEHSSSSEDLVKEVASNIQSQRS